MTGTDQSPDGGTPQARDAFPAGPTDPLIGLLVDDRYRIRARLARGGMGTVYIAQDERLDRPVALKVMHPHLAESAGFVARFRREARAAARIVHPGVVSVFDQGVVHGQGFLVMELVDGPNLRTVLQAQGALTVDRALRIAEQVLDALRAAHRVGVIHRDVKPENVLVPSEGPVRVTDFGLARAASEVSMSTTGSMLGTVAYMPPEIATTGRTDPRTDIYSVGIMVFEMLVGHVPWDGDSAMQVAYAHVNHDVPVPSDEQPWLPREVDDLVASLAARDPDDRPVDAAQAIDLIERTRAALPADVLARRAEVAPPPPPGTGSDTARLSAAGQTSSLPASFTTTSQAVVHASGVAPTPSEGTRRTRRSRARTLLTVLLVLLLAGGAGGWWWWTQYGPGSYVALPATAGRAATAVESDLTALGLDYQVVPTFDDTVPKGVVIDSEPQGGGAVHKDTEVRLSVSQGVDMRTVPSVVGKTREAASSALTDAGLAVGALTEDWSEDVPQGTVISQGSDAGTSVPHDTAVDLVVSKGRQPIPVPDVTGHGADDAKAQIQDAGLVPQPAEAFSSDVPQGVVISQDTAAGTSLHRGDAVAYTVSKGPEMVEVPSVTGKQLEEAQKILEDRGFTVSVQKVLGGYFNTVRATDPAEGTLAPKGSAVTISVV